MTHPEQIYWGLLLLTAVPLAPFNTTACVVLGMRIANQAAFAWGMTSPSSEAFAQMVIGLCGGAIGLMIARGWKCDVVAALSFLLAGIPTAFLSGLVSEATWWWAVFWVACAQALLLPLCTDWSTVRAVWRVARDPANIERLKRVMARLWPVPA